jgi:hypothetical protein
MKYTQEEVHMAIGTEIEYHIPAQVWTNYTKPAVRSSGKLVELPPYQKGRDDILQRNGAITVHDTTLNAEIVAPWSGIVNIPFIDSIRATKLYRLLE